MGDVSDFFKSGFLSAHKNAMGRNYQQKTLNDRMSNFNNIRRETRHTLMLQKRQINENMTPINTPEPTKRAKKVTEKREVQKPNKRLEMLNKWKAEKEKRKQEEQKKAKPLFKVCHVPVEVGLPNLENVNKEIKGKPIKSNPTPIKSQFAPANHKFRAPKNIKPININYKSNNTSSFLKTKMEGQKINSSETNKSNSRLNLAASPRNTRSVTSRKEQTSKLNEKLNIPSKKSRIKTEINKINPGQNKNLQEKALPVDPKIEDKNKFRAKIKEPPQKSTPNIGTRKKLQFKTSPVIENNTSRYVICGSPKKSRKHEKTVNKKRLLIDLDSSGEELNSPPKNKEKYESKELNRKNNIETIGEIKKTPKKTNKYKEVPDSKENDIVNKKKKCLRTLKQPKLKESDTMTTFNNCGGSADKTPKKTVGWNVIEIVESDDEVFSKAIANKTPTRITRKYKKTPRKGQNTITIEDSPMEEILTNEVSEERNLYSASKTDKNVNKTPIRNKSLKKHEVERETKRILTNKNSKSSSSTVGSATGSASPDYPVECVSPANRSLNSSSHTPARNVSRDTSPVYISPFVTVSRGKSSARKEYQVRHSAGGCLSDTPEFSKDISNNISPKAGADYFTRKLNNEIARIEEMCDEWSKYKDNNDYPEEANDMIDVAIGQSKLLISKKFQQFRDLIDQCKNFEYKEKPVTCKDLHGFWDMIYMQVEDLNKRFNSLDVLKANNWQEVVLEKKPVVKRGRGRPKKIAASSTLKSLIKAARNMKKSSEDGGNNLIAPQSQVTMFGGDYCSTKSPVRDREIPTPRPSSARKSLRVSLLTNQAKKRMSSSPGLTMMKISQAIKCGDGLTPSKSILKTDLTKSANRVTKSVLFKDDLENNIEKQVKSAFKNVDDSGNKENDSNEINLISFSPVTPTRRSRRLSRIN